MSIETNWHVITGGPSSGKSTVIERLAVLGYATIPEAARGLIDAETKKGRTISEIRADEADFQRRVLRMKIEIENKLPPEQITFFDRGIPDTIVYYRLCHLDTAPVIEESRKRRYRSVFFLEQLPFEKDYARVEDGKTVEKLNQLLRKSYENLGYEVIRVPAKPVEERVKFILNRLNLWENFS